MKILVIGCGSIGRRHIRLLKEMGVEVVGLDTNSEMRHAVWDLEADFTANPAHLYGPGGLRVDGVVVATPNHLHVDPSRCCIDCGIPVLVEKPLAHTVQDAERLLYGVVPNVEVDVDPPPHLLVGYCLRFHPGLRRVKELLDQGSIGQVRHASIHFGSYLPDWRPGTDYRTNYAASKVHGGGILMDASHELDYACWLFGRPVSVSCTMQNTGALEIDTEDIADLVVRFESGMQANIHLDYLSQEPSRWCTVVGDEATARWSFETDFVWLRNGAAQAKPVVPDDLYRAELQHFIACIRGEERPLVTGADGIMALRIVEAAKRSSAEGRAITL